MTTIAQNSKLILDPQEILQILREGDSSGLLVESDWPEVFKGKRKEQKTLVKIRGGGIKSFGQGVFWTFMEFAG